MLVSEVHCKARQLSGHGPVYQLSIRILSSKVETQTGFPVYLRGTQMVGHSHRGPWLRLVNIITRQQRYSCPPPGYLRGRLNVVWRRLATNKSGRVIEI